jgi:CRISPR-associated protein Cmx8
MSEKEITLRYDPYLLPTVQHRAGLAGLLVLIESMRRRSLSLLPRINRQNGSYEIIFTKDSFTNIFNELYDVKIEERQSRTKKKNPKRIEKKLDKKTNKKITIYVYDQVVPRAAFLSSLGMPDIWIKLWQDVMWTTIRGISTTRKPYEKRAKGENINTTNKLWEQLVETKKNIGKKKSSVDGITSSLYLGAQEKNAEQVSFKGRADENLLLHFWSIVMGFYVPGKIDEEGEIIIDRGYIVVIPDIEDYEGFLEEYPHSVARMKKELKGYRPQDSIMSVPGEGGLEYAYQVLVLAQTDFQEKEAFWCFSSMEIYWLHKEEGKNTHILFSGRVDIDRQILANYKAVRNRYFHPLFRRQIIINILRGTPWYKGFDQLFSVNKSSLFLGNTGREFQRDVRERFALDREGGTIKGD